MAQRSRAREVALQLLFQRDMNATADAEARTRFARERLKNPALEAFCLSLFEGVVANATAIDERLAAAAENWRLQRMAVVDRNVLRMGAFELLHCPDTPPAVAFDEAIELARRYGSVDSSAFVNGVLERLRRDATASA